MNTIYSTLVLLVSLATSVQAQDTVHQSNAGIKGGYNLAAVRFDGSGETGQRHGFHIGVYGESFISESFSIQPELLYSQQGYEIKDANGFTQKLDYINLPILLKAYPSKNFF
jgi:opacity protein-like surface antigen